MVAQKKIKETKEPAKKKAKKKAAKPGSYEAILEAAAFARKSGLSNTYGR